LRLLGRGKVQSEAIAELIALPPSHPYRQQTIQHLAVLQIHLKTRQNKTKDVREVIMSLSPVYEKWRQETLAEGRQEGRQEGVELGIREGIQEERRSLALKMLQENFPTETIARLTSLSIAEVEQLQLAD
jgi:predicted transposase/invertase (TIGR01784 family)